MAQQGRTIVLAFVWYLIVSEYLLFTFFWLYSWCSDVLGFCVSFLFQAVYFLLLPSYYYSIMVPAGAPSRSGEEQILEGDIEVIKERAKQIKKQKELRKRDSSLPKLDELALLQEVSYCFSCKCVKPLRTHHCSTCQACVLRMDHHCPWVGNCVGLRNHKLFLLFLFYATFDLTLLWIAMAIDHVNQGPAFKGLQGFHIGLYIYTEATAFFLSASIGFLLVTQLMNFSAGITTLQSFTDGMTKSGVFDKGGMLANMREVMGESEWWNPLRVPFTS